MTTYFSKLLSVLRPYRAAAAAEARMNSRITSVEQSLLKQVNDLQAQLLATREQTAAIVNRQHVREKRNARSAAPYDCEEYLNELEANFPVAFPIWKQLFDAGAAEYEARLPSSLSVTGNAGSDAFRQFLSLHIRGHVLDIGCGPQELPSYLAGHQIDRLAGIDPLPRSSKADFEFVQGFAECLPWPTDEFDTITVATSLDHVLSLDMALSEIKRVLRADGTLVMWVSFIAGAQPYDPLDPTLKPIDHFHLFHFDRGWFLELMTRYFILREEFPLDLQSHFFAFSKP